MPITRREYELLRQTEYQRLFKLFMYEHSMFAVPGNKNTNIGLSPTVSTRPFILHSSTVPQTRHPKQ